MAEKINGIFLTRRKHTSGSLVTTFLTDEEGLKSFYFRGGEKKSAMLYPLAEGSVIYSPNKRMDLLPMSGFESLHPDNFAYDPRRGAIAFFIAELLMKCTTENNPDAALYERTSTLREALNNEDRVALLPLYALVLLMDPLGICIAVDREEHSGQVLDIQDGVIRGGIDSEKTPGGRMINWLADQLTETASSIVLSREESNQLLRLLLHYYAEHFPGVHKMKSLEVLHETMN